jgi:hypothetical protein
MLKYCISIPGPSKMIGRPALYKIDFLKKVGVNLSFNGVGNEDAALSIKMEAAGARSGIGNGFSFRYHPPSLYENIMAWKKYGYGDAMLILQYPNKIYNIILHLLFNYPARRSYLLLKKHQGNYIAFPILTAFFRLVYMLKALVKMKLKEYRKHEVQ